VFPVGGWGTRFLPATKAIPKAILPIIDKPIIHYCVEEVVAADIRHIVLVTGSNARAIEDYFSSLPELEYFLQHKHEDELLNQVRAISSLAFFCSTRSVTRTEVKGL